jgi:ribosomal protein S18 acetylase RimI-like enzyme
MALTLLGYRATSRLLLTVARSMLGMYQLRQTDAALMHSVVVDARHRGQGLEHTMMDALEDVARQQESAWALLQVFADNVAARRFYRNRGYQDVWQTPRWVAALSWPSYVMQKALT